MRYSTFITTVEQTAGITREEAERAADATLRTLAERITRGEAEDIALFLPRELRPALTSAPEPAEAFDRAEFIRRVAEREGVDADTAAEHARAVFTALGVAVAPGATEAVLETLAVRISRGEVEDLEDELPPYLRPALEEGLRESSAAKPMSLEEFVAHVGEREGASPEEARAHARAVLTALREFISAKELNDMTAQLPKDYAPLLASVA